MSRKVRNDLTLQQKIEVLNKIKEKPPNTPLREFEKFLNVSKSVISRLKKDEISLREKWNESQNANESTRKRKREGKDPDVDEALNKWFELTTGRGVNVSGPLLKKKAEELAEKMGHNEFVASDGWLSRWKVRHAIVFKKAHGEKGSADSTGAEEWCSSRLPQLLDQYSLENIFNADETDLFYRATPDGSLTYKHHNLVGSKKSMDRVTVLCCCNATGSEKRPLLVIGKSKNPRCFKNLNVSRLSVLYRANSNAWMTAAIFSEWLANWDLELQKSGRKILLLIDNATCHPTCTNFETIQVEFLPPNTTSLIQPLDMGIIKNLKVHHRSELVAYILQIIDDKLIPETATAKDVSGKVTLLQAIQFAADSWRKVSGTTCANCFPRCGFKAGTSEVVEEEEELILQRVSNHEEFSSIDDDLPCFNASENIDLKKYH